MLGMSSGRLTWIDCEQALLIQLEMFYISVQHVPGFEATGLVKPPGSFVLPKMSNRRKFHPGGSHLLHPVQNDRAPKTAASMILVCANRFKQSGAV